jgi:hypothetical protein
LTRRLNLEMADDEMQIERFSDEESSEEEQEAR